MKKIQLEIVTPDGVTLRKEVDSMVLPAWKGQLGVLPGHMPLVSVLRPGEMKVVIDGVEEFLALSGGYAQIGPKKVTVLADTAELASEIDAARAKAKLEAKGKPPEKGVRLTDKQMDEIQISLLKEMVRMKVAEKVRRG